MGKKKRIQSASISQNVDLNVLCDLIVVTDAYRSGHRLDYTKLKAAIREGALGKKFQQDQWPIIRKAVLRADEIRGSLADWSDDESDRIRSRRGASLFLGYLFLPIGIILSLLPILFGVTVSFFIAVVFLIIGAGFLLAGYIYYRIRLSEYIDMVFMMKHDKGRRASKVLKDLTQELILTLRNALRDRFNRGIYKSLQDVELELYNADYQHVRFRGMTSRVKRLKKVYVEVQ
ncbi:MAG: hypothetical protein ACP6KW_05510 [Candidatus Thorarchaeota archaeon]